MDRQIYRLRYANFLRKLKAAREESGLTQVEVARALSKTQAFVSKIESGERRLDFVELQEICKLYGKPLSYFEEDLDESD